MAEGDPPPLATQETAPTAQGIARWKGRLLVPFASLEDRNFRLLWLGQLGSALAMWADQVARSWLTWQLTGSATAIGLVNVFRAIPLITLGLLGGVLADRLDKRKLLVAIQIWSLAIHVTMAVIILAGWVRLWHVYLTAFLMGGGMALNQPVRTSIIPQLLQGKLLVNAMSLNSIAINVTRLVGPAGVGFMIALAGDNVGPAYVVASGLYVLIVISTTMISYPGRPSDRPPASMATDLMEGFRYMLLENRTVLALVVLAMGPLAFAYTYVTLLPVFVTEVLHMDASGFGTIQSVSAVGALAGGFALASMGYVPHRGKLMPVPSISYGAAVVLLGGTGVPLLLFAVVIVAGASQTIFRAANNTTLLDITPSRLQGRIVSLTFLDMGVQSMAAIVAGRVTDVWNVSVGLTVLGGMCIAVVALIGVGAPAVRRL